MPKQQLFFCVHLFSSFQREITIPRLNSDYIFPVVRERNYICSLLGMKMLRALL